MGLPRTVLLTLFFAFAIRLIFIFGNQHPLVSDEAEYDSLASGLLTTGSYGVDVPTAYRPVGYPFFLSMCYRMFGHFPLLALVVQALLDTATALLIYLTIRKHSERGAIGAAFIWALYPPAILYSGLLLSESLTVFLLAFCCSLFFRSGVFSYRRSVIVGIALGLLILVKPTFLLFFGFVILFSSRLRLSARQQALIAVSLSLVIVPWMIRNLVAVDSFTLSTNTGMNLYVGNHEGSTAAYVRSFPEELSAQQLSESERNRRAIALATEYIVQHPGTFLVNGIRKIAHVFRTEGDLLIGSFVDQATHSQHRFLDQYRSIPLFPVLFVNFAYFVLLAAGLLGFLSSQEDNLFWITLSLLLTILTVHFVFFGGSRFHFPLMLFLAMYASRVFDSIASGTFALGRFRTLVFASLIIPCLGIWVYEFALLYGT